MTKQSFWQKHAKNSLLIAAFTIAGSVLSAFVTHDQTRRNMLTQQQLERNRALELQRVEFGSQAYKDFLKGQTLLGSEKDNEANQLITDAKMRIILMSSRDVLCSMAEYWAFRFKYKECEEPELMKKDAAIYRNMRREFFKSLNANESPVVEDAVLVPYLRHCVLPGENLAEVCKPH